MGAVFLAFELGWDFHFREKLAECSGTSRYVTVWFRIVCVLDILLGLVFYSEHLHPLTSWFHHFAYFLLCNWLVDIGEGYCVFFTICCLEELPTFILALGSIWKSLRSDFWFGITFFILRICLHTYLTFQAFTSASDDPRMNIVKFNFGLTMSLHAHWFYSYVNQQIRLYKERKDKESKS